MTFQLDRHLLLEKIEEPLEFFLSAARPTLIALSLSLSYSLFIPFFSLSLEILITEIL